MNTAAVWADEATDNKGLKGLSDTKRVLIPAVFLLMLAMAGSAYLYVSGIQSMHSISAQGGDIEDISRVTTRAKVWALQLGLTTAVTGGGLLLLTGFGLRRMERKGKNRTEKLGQELQKRIQKLQDQLADARISEEETCKVRDEMEKKYSTLSETHVNLQEELNRRKLAEKSLTQQTQKLERSKDVLELHVQARTQELQKLQRRNELILDSAGDGICGFDLQGKATFVNPAAARISGWKLEEMIGKTEEEIFFSAKSKIPDEQLNWVKAESGDRLPEQCFLRKDGVKFPAEYIRTHIKEKDKVVGAVVMFKDITERKLAEDRLAHKAEELASSNAELEQFAFVASHDLQEPLRKIQAFGDRLKVKCDLVQLGEGRDYLDRMQNAAARMQRLINDLLAFSRVIRSSDPFVPVDLMAVGREVLGDLETSIEKSKAQVTLGTLPTIDADPTQMRQLLQNVISNALKFHQPNAAPMVKVECKVVTRDEVKDDVGMPKPPPTAKADDKFCILTIKDNGIGFEEQYLEKIFAVFQRLHGRCEYEGTGVGLAVCRRITDRHGGLITAQSKLGEGATFVIILPMHQPKLEEQK
ncbi:sensor histidine kinase [Pedosphaera parvula]|uniref:histidine kinase n=1 Tax=Pedosphaera parvula (strain Ellin514) TaxID=320771 RepID=B9XE85_PEDPL|nr:ATP-binding protein [Pedosphaera parvula]EEF61976.1 multi-sensor signal transduction histidine kinase [Pedosphaera parvula Ellin514]